MNNVVSYKIAKLLTDKGYNIPSDHYYDEDGDIFQHITFLEKDEDYSIYAPTISEVVMWLYEKHGIWINGELYAHLGNVSKFQFTIQSHKSKSTNSIVQLNINPFNSPAEAYEAAIEYTLKNLL